jgi:hypothetical protein
MSINSFHKAFYHLELALRYCEDVAREAPGTLAAKKAAIYSKRLTWMKMDFASDPAMPSAVTSAFMKEMKGDVFFPAAIAEKVLQLPEEARDALENIVDTLLKGEEIQVTIQ